MSHYCIKMKNNGTRINADIADLKTDLNLATLIFDSTSRNDFQ